MKRRLTENEIAIVKALLAASGYGEELMREVDLAYVEEMDDGGMGSLRFFSADTGRRSLGKTVANAEFQDSDGVPVNLCLNLDDEGNLFELDVWKVNFSKLKTLPAANKLRIY